MTKGKILLRNANGEKYWFECEDPWKWFFVFKAEDILIL